MRYIKSLRLSDNGEIAVYGRRNYAAPLVNLTLTKHSGDEDGHFFMGEFRVSPKVARKIAKHLLKAADAAEQS